MISDSIIDNDGPKRLWLMKKSSLGNLRIALSLAPSALSRRIAPRKYNYQQSLLLIHSYRHFFVGNIERFDGFQLTLNMCIYIIRRYNKKTHPHRPLGRPQFPPFKWSPPKPRILNNFYNILISNYFNYFLIAFNKQIHTTKWYFEKAKKQSPFLRSQLIKIPNTYISLLACTLQICSTISWNSSVKESKNAEVVWRTPGGKISLKSIGFIKSTN